MTPASATTPLGSQIISVSWRQRPLEAVQCGQPLPGASGAHRDGDPALFVDPKGVHVERVQRLPKLEHDVVRHVDDVVDGARTGGGHLLGEPLRRGADLHVADDARGVARAESRVFDLDRALLGSPSVPASSGRWTARSTWYPSTAATSRATPAIDRQSGRLGVISSSMHRVRQAVPLREASHRPARRPAGSSVPRGPHPARARAPSSSCPR